MQAESNISDDHSLNHGSISTKNTVINIDDEPLNLSLNSSSNLWFIKQAIRKQCLS